MEKIAKHRDSRTLIIVACCVAIVLVAAALLVFFEPWKQQAASSGIEPRQHLSEYSWEELARIGKELSTCNSETEALRHARAYGLCSNDGTLPADELKSLELTNGVTVNVRLAGIWHDQRSDGRRAGLSFVFADAVEEHSMNHAFENALGKNADSVGGWSASDMRAWLSSDLYYKLPVELRNSIVSVEKSTANIVRAGDEGYDPGHLSGSSTDWITSTSDKLWLLSATELCGAIPAAEDLDIDESISQVYRQEGSQYRLFATAQVAAFQPCELLACQQANTTNGLPCTWWLRTKTLEFGEGFWLVGTDGAALPGIGECAAAIAGDEEPTSWGPDHARGVIVGFCL